MAQEELFDRTVRHMSEYLEQDLGHVRPESRLDGIAGNLDSLKIFEMLLYLEECFAVPLQQSALEDVETVQDLVGCIGQALAVKAAAS